jgi:hypothetical protein
MHININASKYIYVNLVDGAVKSLPHHDDRGIQVETCHHPQVL